MYQSFIHQSPLKEGRRILSEKNANACLSPARSPTKQALLHAPSPSPKKLLPSPLFAPSFIAQKRSIGQVHEEDASSLPVPGHGQRVDHGPDAMNIDVPEQTTQPAKSTSEEQVDPAITLPRAVPSDPETRKQFIQEKAILLRSRLQNAMRRVRDHQIDRRVSELEEHSRKYPRLSASVTSKPSDTGVGLQQHLEQKYGPDGNEDDDEPMLSTPRARMPRDEQEQREIIHISDEDDETTPTQKNQHIATNVDTAPSLQMVLSSPTYNSTTQTGRFDDDRPVAREATIATSPSSSVRGERRGDGDAVDGLLKLMSTPTAGSSQAQPRATGASA
ncbi:uncharacterized protein DSM5745_02982 [Aspergillus mulundensis]|uniref:Uncharacterized protein n=1 Tax=Aspergillus mulundensis TaxID=1810919 RepID=A0A3D8SJ39_9EURO|nr:Uncharacterized protein DSM5745_02982 [Aspergillus mulundensis]RDW86340.1 Uncharacterized protein DSM5745_02982 [Aspergillus mulundensis]